MKRGIFFLVPFVLVLSQCSSKSELASGKKLAEVNGHKITEGDIAFVTKLRPQQSMLLPTPEGKRKIVETLIEKELLYQSALKEDLDNDKKVRAEVEQLKKEILAKARVEKAAEKAAQEHYKNHKEEFEQLRIAHILIRIVAKKGQGHSEEEVLKLAEEIKIRLNKGEDFAKVAQEFSEDVLTKGQGGDLGFVSRNDRRLERQGLLPLAEKAFSMKVGEVSEPLKVEDGIHLVRLIEGPTLKPFEEVKESLIFRLRENARQELVSKLKEKAKIDYFHE